MNNEHLNQGHGDAAKLHRMSVLLRNPGWGRHKPLLQSGKKDIDGYHDICPLVPVPPHGRLIEKGTILDKCYQHFEDYMNGIVDGKTALLNIEKEIKAAPTIIPADPAEEGET